MARILIVDDSPVDRITLKKCFEHNGHEVIAEAKNGHEALDFYKNLSPDIVLLDIVMLNESGLDVLKQLMNYDKNAKIIMCTSSAHQGVIVNAMQFGAKYFLVKPVTNDALMNTVQKILEAQ